MRDADHLDRERTKLQRIVSGLGVDELRGLRYPMFVELRLDEAEREPRRDDRLDLDLTQEIRKAADVILVPVREDDSANTAPLEVSDVRKQEVDAEMLVARESQARVDDDDLSGRLVDGHVLADLAEAAERDDPQRVAHRPVSLRALCRTVTMRRRGRAGRAAPGSRESPHARGPWPRRVGDVGRPPRARADSART